MKLSSVVLLAVLGAFSAGLHAQPGAVHRTSGKVTRVDAVKGAVTIAHGAVATLNWPAMTMTFKAHEKSLLAKVKPGAQVEFAFVQSGKDYSITEIR